MKRKHVLFGLFALVMGIIVGYTFMGGETDEAYAERIMEERKEKDRFMRNSDESPFVEAKAGFVGLQYFTAQPKYKVKAKLEKIDSPKIVSLGTNDGKSKDYLTYGYAAFTLDGQAGRLLVLESVSDEEDDGSLFLAFGDGTSALTTYGAGRYMDLQHDGGRSILLDFNLAYNPYCAYNERYTCPLPPPENLLPFPIPAGEKAYATTEQ